MKAIKTPVKKSLVKAQPATTKTPIQDLSLSINADELTLNSNIDTDTKKYLSTITNRSTNEAAVVKLLTTKFKGAKRTMLIDSNIQSTLSRKWLMAIASTGAARWILDILDGKATACPIPKGQGLHSSPVIQYFKDNQANRIETVASEKAAKKLAKEADKVIETNVDTDSVSTDSVSTAIPLDSDSLFAQYSLLTIGEQMKFIALINSDIKAIMKVNDDGDIVPMRRVI